MSGGILGHANMPGRNTGKLYNKSSQVGKRESAQKPQKISKRQKQENFDKGGCSFLLEDQKSYHRKRKKHLTKEGIISLWRLRKDVIGKA